MNFIRHAALAAYYLGTRTRRRQETARRASVGTEPVSVLFYHRVADTHPNDWTIDTRTFTRQVNWLARNFDLVDLAEAQRRPATGSNSRPTVCITFDDGYISIYDTAFPLLQEFGFPFTLFLSTGPINDALRGYMSSAANLFPTTSRQTCRCHRIRRMNFVRWQTPVSRLALTRAPTPTWAKP